MINKSVDKKSVDGKSVDKKSAAKPQIWVVTPFERPDAGLADAAAKAGAFPVLHLGQSRPEAQSALDGLSARVERLGVCMTQRTPRDILLPGNVQKIIIPWGMKPPESAGAEIVWQVGRVADAEGALAAKAKTLILKGCEGAGLCGTDSAFMLFQKLIGTCREAGAEIFVQGGIGVHAAAAYMALGATGVVVDSQTALFPECGLSSERKAVLAKLTGTEIRTCQGYNYYIFPGSKGRAQRRKIDDILDPEDLLARIRMEDSDVLPLGQDIILAPDLADRYESLIPFVRGLKREVCEHVEHARHKDCFSPGGTAAESLGTVYPIAQGPMARVSDSPDFLRSVADSGALPFLSMSMMTGEGAAEVLRRTAEVMEGKPWGVGILGFAYPKILEEQTTLILAAGAPFVLIAGGRPAQRRVFEQAGVKVLLHAPAPGLLDVFLKEGVRTFVFEGRESGGHVGSLFSVVLWEKQINRLLQWENLSDISAFFAGGIHDALSAAFVRIMAGPLAARDVNVALLCGTAYLYTEEAVGGGAIPAAYQRLLLEKDRTLLLKSGNGQETRCVPSPYTERFMEEKTRMEKDGLNAAMIIMKLEELNLGRLRIAAKGIERVNDKLVSLSEEEQMKKGLYMTGTVTEMTETTTTMAALHRELTIGSLRRLREMDVLSSEDCGEAS